MNDNAKIVFYVPVIQRQLDPGRRGRNPLPALHGDHAGGGRPVERGALRGVGHVRHVEDARGRST